MPYNRPGPGVYVKNTEQSGTLTHGQPVSQNNFVGVAVKQKTRGWKEGYDVQAVIADDEDFFIITKGIVQVANTGISSAAKGDAVYIDSSNNLTAGATGGNDRFGRIVEVAGERGTPAGKVRIDLDAKDTIAAASG